MRDGQWQRFHSPLSVFRIKPCWPRCFLWVVCSARSTSSSLCALIALLAHISLSGGHHFLFRLAVQGCKAWVSQKCLLAGVQPDLNVIFRIPFQMLDAGIVEFELWHFLPCTNNAIFGWCKWPVKIWTNINTLFKTWHYLSLSFFLRPDM